MTFGAHAQTYNNSLAPAHATAEIAKHTRTWFVISLALVVSCCRCHGAFYCVCVCYLRTLIECYEYLMNVNFGPAAAGPAVPALAPLVWVLQAHRNRSGRSSHGPTAKHT